MIPKNLTQEFANIKKPPPDKLFIIIIKRYQSVGFIMWGSQWDYNNAPLKEASPDKLFIIINKRYQSVGFIMWLVNGIIIMHPSLSVCVMIVISN